MNLIELAAVIILVTAMTLNGVSGPSAETYGTTAARVTTGAFNTATGLATQYAGGVTLAVAPETRSGRVGSSITIYVGRPLSGTSAGRVLDKRFVPTTLSLGGNTSFGVFLSSQSRVSLASPWAAWTTYASDPGGCAGTASITAVDRAATLSLSCTDGRVVPN